MAPVSDRIQGSTNSGQVDTPPVLIYSKSPQSQNASLEAARKLYGLGRFRDSTNILKDICKKCPEDRFAKQELTRTISRLLEQQRGFYNFRAIYAEAASLRPPCLDCATYTGAIEVRETKRKGMGMFTRKAVKAGDLLLCEKALGYNYADDAESANDMHLGTVVALTYNIIQKLSKNQHLVPVFNDMFHGNHAPATGPKGELIVDPILVQRVVALNSFGGSLSSRAAHLADTESASGHSSGIWVQAARLNHSCFSNCRRSFIGDMQILRAAQDIPAHTELTHPYRIPAATDHDYEKTQQELRSYGFICGCSLCVDAKRTSEDVMSERARLKNHLLVAFSTGSSKGTFDCARVDTARIEQVLAMLAMTYPKSAQEVPRTGMWDPYLALTRMYIILGRVEKVVWASLKTMEVLGFNITGAQVHLKSGDSHVIVIEKWGLVVDYLVECWLMIWTAYASLGDFERADMARALASVSYRIVVGEDETFEETYGSKAREFIAKGKLWTNI